MIIRANTATSIIERGSVATIRRASPSVHPKAFEVEQDAI